MSKPPPSSKKAASLSSPPPGTDQSEFQRLLEEVEDGFQAILEPSPEFLGESPDGAPTKLQQNYDDKEVRVLFDEIAANYVKPVRQLMLELRVGNPPREWLEVATPAMGSLKRSAQGMGLTDLVAACDNFLVALELASAEKTATINEDARGTLSEAYGGLEHALPEAFDLNREAGRREPLIIRTLLLSVPGVGKVTLDKIYDAGLNSLDMFMVAKTRDLSDATNVPADIAEKILARFQAYKREAVIPDGRHLLPHDRLSELANLVRRHHEAYERSGISWSNQAREERRQYRQDRTSALLEVNLLLARMGEVDLVNEMEPLPVERKISRLFQRLEESKNRG